MEVSKEELAARYASQEDESLVELFLGGELTKDAFECLLKEIISRSLFNYEFYQKMNLCRWRESKENLERNIVSLNKEKKALESDVDKLKNPKKKGLIALALERRRLEEEAKIKLLKNQSEQS